MKIKILLGLAIFASLSFYSMESEEKTKLIYIGDPMCSWCYGFAPELEKTIAQLPKNVEFEIILGGLRVHGTESMKELKHFLKDHWREVENKTGQEFNYEILESCTMNYDTEPACRAVVTMGKLMPKSEFAYFSTIQKGFYKHNYLPNAGNYAQQAKEYGVDSATFVQAFHSKEIIETTMLDFRKARTLGVNSFPSLVLVYDNKTHKIAQGFAKSEDILKRIDEIMGTN